MDKQSNAGRLKARSPRRALWVMLLLWVVIACGVVAGARYYLHQYETQLLQDNTQALFAHAQSKAASMTVWGGAIFEQATQLTSVDTIRLFATELAQRNADIARIRTISELASADETMAFAPTLSELDATTALGGQGHLIRRQMLDFIMRYAMADASLLNSTGQIILSSILAKNLPTLEPFLAEPASLVLASGKGIVLPAYLDEEGRLIMNVILPVFAPRYIDNSGTKVVGAIIFGVNATQKVEELSFVTEIGVPGESTRIMQVTGTSTQLLTEEAIIDLDSSFWKADEHGNLPAAVRSLPAYMDNTPTTIFSVGLNIPGLPMLVEQDLAWETLNTRYSTYRQGLYIGTCLIIISLGLLLVVLWWWLMGKRERAVSAELRSLYDTVNQQKQIIDSVNTTLTDGIVLSDMHGYIPYANQAFAAMVEENLSDVSGKNCQNLTAQDIAQNIARHTSEVRQANGPLTFMEILEVMGESRYYQVDSSPLVDPDGNMSGVVSVYRDISSIVLSQMQSQNMINQTVNVFVRAIEAVDPYLRGQATYTGSLAVQLAYIMGLEDHEATLYTAASLSQIGMIQLPREILNKTGTLTADERAELHRHVEYAQNVLEGIDFGLPIVEAIVQMHERLDGSGYPNNLTGDQIGIDGRILAVAATFCAVLRPRSYRQAKTMQDVMAILATVPHKYDQNVVGTLRVFLQTPEGLSFYEELTEINIQ